MLHAAMCRWTAPTGSMPGSMGSLGSSEENTVRSLEDIMRSVDELMCGDCFQFLFVVRFGKC